jgi:asparagine synthase (glutamine-hydrolysing)
MVAVSAVTLGRHAADFGVTLTLPLLDDRFVATLAALGGRDGWGSRTAAMHQIGSELLPPAVLGRSTKARFHEVYMGARSRRFAAEPDSAPGDPRLADLVDATRLRAEWASPVVDIRSALALQASWIAVRSDTNVRNV